MLLKNFGLIALALGGFGIGTTEFIIIGLLPDIAESLKLTIPEAGHIISIYAFGVVLGAPILTGVLSKTPPAKTFITLMICFTVFNGLTAFASNYYNLLLLRFLSGLPHGAFFGVGAVVAGQLVKPGKEGSAIALMFGGLTFANVIGVPLAIYIGHQWSWRMPFIFIGMIGVSTIIAIKYWIPYIKPGDNGGIVKNLHILKRPNLWLAIILTSIGFGRFFSWMSYIVPLFIEQSRFSQDTIPFMMTLSGIGMAFGNWVGGKLVDRISSLKVVIALMLTFTVILILNGIFSSSQFIIAVLTFCSGTIAMGLRPTHSNAINITFKRGRNVWGITRPIKF